MASDRKTAFVFNLTAKDGSVVIDHPRFRIQLSPDESRRFAYLLDEYAAMAERQTKPLLAKGGK